MTTRARLQKKIAQRKQSQQASNALLDPWNAITNQMDRFRHEGKMLELEVQSFNDQENKKPEDGQRILEKCELYKRLLGAGEELTQHCDVCKREHSFIRTVSN